MAKRNDDEPTIGHNSAMTKDEKKKLDGYVRQIVQLEQDKAETQADIGGIYQSVKDANFSVQAVRRIVKAKLQTQEQKLKEKTIADLTDTYMHALGMLADTPLGQAAMQRDIEGAGNSTDVSDRPFAPN